MLPPGPEHRRAAIATVACLCLAVALAAPFAEIPLPGPAPLLPAYAAAVLIGDALTTGLLFALFAVSGTRALLVLGAGYLFAGMTIVPWLVSFPGMAEQFGLTEIDKQATAWIAALRRVGFPAFALAYLLLSGRSAAETSGRGIPWVQIALTAGAVLAFGACAVWLIVSNAGLLPEVMADTRTTTALWRYVPASAGVLSLASLALLAFRERSRLDLWLAVALTAWIAEMLLMAYLSSGTRLTVGWWLGRLFGLASAGVVLMALLAETAMLHVRLARSLLAERRAREARLSIMGTLSASVAHEVNQPLAGMIKNANAAMRWLDRDEPQHGEAREALARIIDDGHRAGSVIREIRAIFEKGAGERVTIDLNRLVAEAVDRARRGARLSSVSVALETAPGPAEVTGSPVQFEQVISNFIVNAVEAMGAVEPGRRLLGVGGGTDPGGEVEVSVADTGPRVSPDVIDHVFEPFFTTRREGMGMGLMFCRMVIEAHGGRIWVVNNPGGGADFRFRLPRSGDGAWEGQE